MSLRLGIDAGAVSVKLAVLDPAGRLVWGIWQPHLGRPLATLAALLEELQSRSLGPIHGAAVTGSGGWPVREALGLAATSEIRAQAEGALAAEPAVRTVIEIGGQDSKLIRLANGGGRAVIVEQAMNDLCAAGTGAFLERQAGRLGLAIGQLGELACQAHRAAAVAGRCAVFAQTDVAHLRRAGRPVAEVAAGLCEALARNFLGCLGRGRPLEPPVSLQGGVAANAGVRAAFGRLLGLGDGGLRVPRYHLLTGAIGAALMAEDSPLDLARAAEGLRGFAGGETTLSRLRPLEPPAAAPPLRLEAGRGPCYLGIDIGSVSAKVAAIDQQGRLLHADYRLAEGDAATEAKRLLQEVGRLGIAVRAVAVTGSGRRPAAEATGALAFNEIRAQARGASELCPQARTLIEIGGQDAKLIRLDGEGALRNFEMNRVCAAGTGAFLEEQAARLGLGREELGEAALAAARPVRLGTRCTVFMESDLIHYQQRGVALDDLAAGLCLAAAANYLEKVATGGELADPVAFLGGLAANPGVVAAMSRLLGRPVEVPPGHKVSGAVGAAHLLREAASTPLALRGKNLFAEREGLLFGGGSQAVAQPWVGLPRALLCHRHYPFWRALFAGLGVELRLSPPTDEAILKLSRREAAVETCLPVRLAFGHAAHLLASGAQALLAPVVKEEATSRARAWRCPYVQTLPHLLSHRFGAKKTLSPLMPRVWTARALLRALRPLADSLGAPRRLRQAVRSALAAQRDFEARCRALGEEAVRRAAPGRSVVLLAREYLVGEGAIGHRVPQLLLASGLEPLPHELLAPEAGRNGWREVVWRRGQDYLRSALWARQRGLSVLMLTSFGCGPDSFIEKHLRAVLGERLQVIECDEHMTRSALETRVEAFADVVRSGRIKPRPAPARMVQPQPPDLRQRTIFVPYAGENFHALVSALRSVGLAAEMLPAPDRESETLGRRHCSGRECLPFLYHVGDLVRLIQRPGFEPQRAAFFVPGNDESCRVSQYAGALRLLLDGLGVGQLALFSPKVSMESDEAVDSLGLRFGRKLWRGWVGIEALQRLLLRVRPYEVFPGSADAAYERAREFFFFPGGAKSFWRRLREALRLLQSVPQREGGRRPRVAVIGDYYLRANEFASRGLVRQIEALGGEVVVAPFFTDYLRFQARERPKILWRARRPLALAGSLVRAAGLKRDYARIAAFGLDDPSPAECLEHARGYLGPEVDRPPVASLGELAHYQARGLAGIVNPLPLHCLYGTIFTSAALAFLRRKPLPFLSLTYDGQQDSNLANRLEAFMDQVLQDQRPGSRRADDGRRSRQLQAEVLT